MTLLRVAVVISAVQVKPGPDVRHLFVERDDDLELRRLPLPALLAVPAWIGLLPISVTRPRNVRSGTASIVTRASWPSVTVGMSVSSTSTSASITDMSAIVSSTGPGVVHRADDGRFTFLDVAPRHDAVHRRGDDDLVQVVARRGQAACSCLICCSRVWISCSRGAAGSACRTATSFSARSSASRVVSPSFQSSCWRFRFCCASSRVARACSTRGARLLQRRLRRRDARLAALQLALELSRVDFEQELSGLDALAFLDGQHASRGPSGSRRR